MPLAAGIRLGAYEILGPLGAGGMGEVYRARDLKLGREIAIKVLPAAYASSPASVARFEREARTVAALNHPNIVTLYSAEESDGVPFLTMELVAGETLATLVAPGGLPLERILDIAVPVADALVAAHERGVVHRDLKPGNIMVTLDGRLKVLDFGLATIASGAAPAGGPSLAETAAPAATGEGAREGTFPYMAPEQIRGEAADARSDLFAFGVLLYELAAGRRPFAGATWSEVAASILRDTPEPIARLRPDLPPDLGRIVLRCLEKDRRERIQTALDVANELRPLRSGSGVSARAATAPERVATIAVLPFVNQSPDPEDEYFSDGLTDEFINVLAKIRGLRVAARTSSFTFKGRGASIAEVGRALNVATVLEGSVRKLGNRVRISTHLVKVSDGYYLWSEAYDRTFDDIFAVQDDIARSVVHELRAALLGEESGSAADHRVSADVARAVKGRATDPEAHRLFLQARHLFGRFSREATEKTIEYLHQALALDPEFALAWAELGRAYSREAGFGWTSAPEGYRRAREALARSLELEPDLAEGHGYIGWLRMTYDLDWKGARASYRRALELAPNNVRARNGAGGLAYNLGRTDEAIEHFQQVLAQDPLDALAHNNLGHMFLAGGRFAEAEAACRSALDLAPQSFFTRALLALVLVAQGRGSEALEEAARERDDVVRLWALAIVHHTLGHGPESDAALRELIDHHADDSAIQIAEVHGARGEADAAFEWLERSLAQRDPGIAATLPSPRLRSLHRDPRWKPFLKRIGLEG